MTMSTSKIDFLPSEKQGMARVVCDELARLTYSTPDENVFFCRLVELQKLTAKWAQMDGSSVWAARQPNDDVISDDPSVGTEQNLSKRKRALMAGRMKTGLVQFDENDEMQNGANQINGDDVRQFLSSRPLEARMKATVKCPHCPRMFCFYANLQRHCHQEHGDDISDVDLVSNSTELQQGDPAKAVECPICKKTFLYKGCLRKHQETQHGLSRPIIVEHDLTEWLQSQPEIAASVAEMSSFHCTECEKNFDSLNTLCWHIRVHYVRTSKYSSAVQPSAVIAADADGGAGDAPAIAYMCSVCERQFTNEIDVTLHLNENADSHECADCGRRIESAFYLRIHRMTHRSEHVIKVEPAPQETTAKAVAAARSEVSAANVEKKSRPTQCSVCGVTMSSASNLRKHMEAMHDSETKKFVCHICARQCARRSQLQRHIMTHGGERRFECGKCGRRFLLRDMMRRHMRAVHARLRPHLCNLCGRPFAEKHQLNTHMKIHR